MRLLELEIEIRCDFPEKTALCVHLSTSELHKINRFENGIDVEKTHDLEFIFRFNATFHSKTAFIIDFKTS